MSPCVRDTYTQNCQGTIFSIFVLCAFKYFFLAYLKNHPIYDHNMITLDSKITTEYIPRSIYPPTAGPKNVTSVVQKRLETPAVEDKIPSA